MCLCHADVDSEWIIKITKRTYQSTFVHFIIFYYYHSPPKCTYFRMCVSFLFYYCESHVLRSVLFFFYFICIFFHVQKYLCFVLSFLLLKYLTLGIDMNMQNNIYNWFLDLFCEVGIGGQSLSYRCGWLAIVWFYFFNSTRWNGWEYLFWWSFSQSPSGVGLFSSHDCNVQIFA